MSYDIKEKIAIVTGGASGIGYSCVKELLRNGVKGVTIADIGESKGQQAIKEITEQFGANRAIFIKADVTKAAELEGVFKTSIDTWSGIDIVINNAGILNDGQWEFEIALNCTTVVRGTLLGLQYMAKDKGGKGGVIVNLASILGLQPLPGCPIYVATKHFVVGFDRSMGDAYHYNHTGVKILTMCPGVTDTPLISEANRFALTSITPDIGQQLAKELGSLPAQPTENVARGMVALITTAESGSVWVSEGNEPIYQAHIPDRQTFRK